MQEKKIRSLRVYIGILLFSLLINFVKAQTFTINPSACVGYTQTLIATAGVCGPLTYTWSASPAGPVFSSPNSSITSVSFPASGSFMVFLSTICSSFTGPNQYFDGITINSNPSLVVTQNSPTTCITNNSPKYSKPVHLSVSGASSYTWFPLQAPPPFPTTGAAIDVRPSVSTCYTVVGNTSGCESSAISCITVIPQFSMQVSPDPAVRCMPDSLKLSIINIQSTAVGPVSAWTYSWTEASTSSLITLSSYFSSSVFVFPTSANSYTAEVSDSRDCVSLPQVVNVLVQTCTGINSIQSENDYLLLYPNPVLNSLHWKASKANDPYRTLCIYNSIAQRVHCDSMNGNEGEIDLRFLLPGIYFVTAKGQKPIKLIKE